MYAAGHPPLASVDVVGYADKCPALARGPGVDGDRFLPRGGRLAEISSPAIGDAPGRTGRSSKFNYRPTSPSSIATPVITSWAR
jgi:hypothetical protein